MSRRMNDVRRVTNKGKIITESDWYVCLFSVTALAVSLCFRV
jgi:hypothetical protein